MISCPTSDRLQLLLSDQLSDGDDSALTAHVQTCGRCQETLGDLTRAALPPLRAAPPSPGGPEDMPAPVTALIARLQQSLPHELLISGPSQGGGNSHPGPRTHV